MTNNIEQAASDLLKLAARCEQATGPDRELDVAAHEAAGLHFVMEYWTESDTIPQRNLSRVPRYTASLDAAMTLVPEGWFANVGPRFYEEPAQTKYRATCIKPLWDKWTPYSDWFENIEADAATPALALCAAALRARASLLNNGKGE